MAPASAPTNAGTMVTGFPASPRDPVPRTTLLLDERLIAPVACGGILALNRPQGHVLPDEVHRRMSDPLFDEIELYLKNAREDHAGLEFLQGLGHEGSLRFIEETETAYHRASDGLELTGEEVARITALAHAIARACGVQEPESKEAMSKLVEVGWLMARWFGDGNRQ